MVAYTVLLFVLDRTEAEARLASVPFLALILRRWQVWSVRGDGQPVARTLRGFSHCW